MIPQLTELKRHPITGELVPEVWKIITDFPDYKISNYGRVLSRSREISDPRRTFISKDKILKSHPDGCGYLHLILYLNEKRYSRKIHLLVGNNFLGAKPNANDEVNHIDSDRANNFEFNLEWASRRENMVHSKRRLISKTSRFTGVSMSVDTKPRNKNWTARMKVGDNYKFLGRFETEEEASEKIRQTMEANGIVNKYAVLV